MNVKRKMIILVFFLLIQENFFSQSSFQVLLDLVLENNSEIKKKELEYKAANISAISLNGIYSPQICIGASTSINKNYDFTSFPDGTSVDISLSQSIPGGINLSVIGIYEAIACINQNNLTNIQNNTQIKFMISNSLYPYWAQGEVKDPSIIILEKQKQYDYNQLLCTKKNIIENLLLNYATALILKNNIQIYDNYLILTQKQIDAYNEDTKLGYTNLSKITELENKKLSYQQELISVQYNYEECISNLNNLCGFSFNQEILQNSLESVDNIIKYIREHTNNVKDPYEENFLIQIEMLKLKRIKQKENNSPQINFAITPTWKNDETNRLDSCSLGLDIDFSSMLNSVNSNLKKQSEIEVDNARIEYDAYLNQRTFLKSQYDKLFKLYSNQRQRINVLLENNKNELHDMKNQLNVGDISIVDYATIETNLINLQLSKKCIEINCWLYEILDELYSFE